MNENHKTRIGQLVNKTVWNRTDYIIKGNVNSNDNKANWKLNWSLIKTTNHKAKPKRCRNNHSKDLMASFHGFFFMLETPETSRRRQGETLTHRVIISRGVFSLYIFIRSAILHRSSCSSSSSPSSATMAAAFRLAVRAPPRRRCRRPSSSFPLSTLYSSLCCHLKCPSNSGGPISAPSAPRHHLISSRNGCVH